MTAILARAVGRAVMGSALALAVILGGAIPSDAASIPEEPIQEVPMEDSVPRPQASAVVTIDAATGLVLWSEPAPMVPFLSGLGAG